MFLCRIPTKYFLFVGKISLLPDYLQWEDVTLAAVSMRPIPLAPMMEKLSLTLENYGTVPRFFVQTLDDHMLSSDNQEKLVRENPRQGVHKGSNHCPFFSKPQALNRILLEIAGSTTPPLDNKRTDNTTEDVQKALASRN